MASLSQTPYPMCHNKVAHGVLFPERLQDHTDLCLSRSPITEGSLDSLGLLLR